MLLTFSIWTWLFLSKVGSKKSGMTKTKPMTVAMTNDFKADQDGLTNFQVIMYSMGLSAARYRCLESFRQIFILLIRVKIWTNFIAEVC